MLQIPMPPPQAGPSIEGRWLEVVSNLDPKYGGLSAAVPALGEKLNATGRLDVTLAAFCAPDEQFRPPGYKPRQLTYWPATRSQWLREPSLRARFKRQLRLSDGVHIHGLWEASTALAADSARNLGIPYILSAHGMLEPWALKNKRLKKLLYSFFIERRNVSQAACLHALTAAEAQQFLAFGARSPIVIIPNAVAIPEVASSELFYERFPALQGKRLVLFLGRLHPKKGVALLLDAWPSIAAGFPDAHLVLAGPGEEPYLTTLRESVTRNALEGSVTFTGMLHEAHKWSALAASEAFVLPSHSEGLSVSVLEAMGMGLPVIVTRACNMPEIEQFHTGWQIEPEVEELTHSLSECLSNTRFENQEIGVRGAFLIQSRYSWSTVAKRTAELYLWVQDHGSQPGNLQIMHP